VAKRTGVDMRQPGYTCRGTNIEMRQPGYTCRGTNIDLMRFDEILSRKTEGGIFYETQLLGQQYIDLNSDFM
jgi:hypothetical protein